MFRSKYPLAVVDALLDAYGSDIGAGYDIGCRFGKTLASSPLGPRAKELGYRSLVGSFHGHVHNRICQLSFLATYVEGMGLEDLEGCERFFSKSNALASSVRHASIFHRKQRIVEFLKHTDENETYQNLSKSLLAYSMLNILMFVLFVGQFLASNYRQALDILKGETAFRQQMAAQGVKGTEVFSEWLTDERAYLVGLKREPLQETWQMEYWQKLVTLAASQ